jgi:hypothetical protein
MPLGLKLAGTAMGDALAEGQAERCNWASRFRMKLETSLKIRNGNDRLDLPATGYKIRLGRRMHERKGTADERR